jgi:hypothetical protein
MVGYNVQSAVDTKHRLIVTHEVTNIGSDRSQLSRMSEQARSAIGSEAVEAVIDRGYFSGEEIVACEQKLACEIRQRRSPNPWAGWYLV